MGEVGHAAARQQLSLEEANTLINDLHAKYQYVFDLKGGNPGVPFDQAYNLKTLTPLPAWHNIYKKVKKELRSLGLSAL